MNLFIADEVGLKEAILTDEEFNHCVKVLRYQTGDLIHLTDGKGKLFNGRIKSISKKECVIQVESIEEGIKHPYSLHIAIAPTKNISRFEWFLEKAVEIGIDEVTPLICEHSERKHIQAERANKIIRSAVKQSLKTHLPILHPHIKIADFLKQHNECTKIAAHYDAQNEHLGKFIYLNNAKYLIAIGPEGDFSENELEAFKAGKWQFANLGNYRLRTETAGIAAAQIVSSHHW